MTCARSNTWKNKVCSIREKLPPLLAYREATNREEIGLITDF